MVDNPTVRIADTPLADWVKVSVMPVVMIYMSRRKYSQWDSGGSSVSAYARKMSSSAWGGGIEMASVSKMKGVNVHVYEQTYGGFKRISAFDHEESPETKPTIRVLYGGGVHYGKSEMLEFVVLSHCNISLLVFRCFSCVLI